MLAVFEKSITNPPEELSLPSVGRPRLKSGQEIAETFRSWSPDLTSYQVGNDNILGLSNEESSTYPRSIVVMDDIFCIFTGNLYNTCQLRRHYGLSRQATEAMIIVEAYRVLRDRAPYPPDQVIKELEGKFAFTLTLKLLNFFWPGTVMDVWNFTGEWQAMGPYSVLTTQKSSQKPVEISILHFLQVCCVLDHECLHYPEVGCRLQRMGRHYRILRLISFDHPLYKVRAIAQEDDEGKVCAVIFQVDLYTRLHSIPRSGSAANWSGATAVEGD